MYPELLDQRLVHLVALLRPLCVDGGEDLLQKIGHHDVEARRLAFCRLLVLGLLAELRRGAAEVRSAFGLGAGDELVDAREQGRVHGAFELEVLDPLLALGSLLVDVALLHPDEALLVDTAVATSLQQSLPR